MYPDLMYELAKDRMARRTAYAERKRLERLALRRPRQSSSLPARWFARSRTLVAQALFGLAFAVDEKESWRVVWDRMSGGGRS